MNYREFFTTHTWWGKLLGGIFGYLIGGSAGAFFGVLIGNFFDKGFASHYSNPYWIYQSEKNKGLKIIFLNATFSVMGHVAKADGRISEQEIEVAQLIMHEMNLNKEQIKQAKILFSEGKRNSFHLIAALDELKKASKENRLLLKLFLDIQYKAALADELTKKINVLDIIFTQLDFTLFHKQYRFYEHFDYQYESQEKSQYSKNHSSSSQRYQSPHNKLEYAYALLEVSQNANKQEIKRAYRRLINRNHPDKLIARGSSEEEIKIANDKTQKIVKAYDLICKNKGW